MYPPLFGDRLWDTALIIALNFPEIAQDMHSQYFANLMYGIVYLTPCPSCSSHGVTYVVEHPPIVRTRDQAVAYVVDFHNSVNVKLGKATMNINEAKAALLQRLEGDYKDLPRAQQMRKEDSARIIALQEQVKKLEGGGTITSNNSDAVFYTAIALGIALLIMIIVVILLARHNKYLRDKR